MNPKETLKKIRTMLSVQVALETMKLENGVEIEAEVFEAGSEVFIVQEGEKVALPEGEYNLEDGRVLVVSEEGVIGEIKEKEEAPAEPEAPMDEPEMSQAPEAPTAPKKVVESVSKETHFKKVAELEKTIAELKAQIEEFSLVKKEDKEDVELSVEPVSHNPESLSKENKKNKTQKRLLTTQDIVFAKLFKN